MGADLLFGFASVRRCGIVGKFPYKPTRRRLVPFVPQRNGHILPAVANPPKSEAIASCWSINGRQCFVATCSLFFFHAAAVATSSRGAVQVNVRRGYAWVL